MLIWFFREGVSTMSPFLSESRIITDHIVTKKLDKEPFFVLEYIWISTLPEYVPYGRCLSSEKLGTANRDLCLWVCLCWVARARHSSIFF